MVENSMKTASMNWKHLYKRADFWLVKLLTALTGLHWLKKFNFAPETMVQEYWPLLFVAAGIYLLISTRYRDATSSLMLISLGVILFLIRIEILTPEFIQIELPDILLCTLRRLIDVIMYVL